MAVTVSWRKLPSTPSATVPPLLVSFEAGTADYTVRVTDMANVWTESLDRRRICMRAWDQNTSIDPSDTPENMAKFLSSLESALDPSHDAYDKTSLALKSGSSDEGGKDGLVIKISCEIPGLQTLRWMMQLSKAPSSAIASAVVLPLLQAQHARAQETEALIEIIRRKDSVMTKLLDKLAATGTGLENVFNSLSTSISGRKRISRAAAEEKIRGLAPFDQGKWLDEVKSATDRPTDVNSLLDRVFLDFGVHSSMEIDETPGLDQWWHHFRGTQRVPLHHKSNKTPTKPMSPSVTEKEETADDDDFQIQSTPPGLPSRGQGQGGDTAATEGDSTASERDSPSPSPSKRTPSKTKRAASRAPVRLGAIGGKRQLSKQSSPSPKRDPPQNVPPNAQESDTASEADEDPTASVPDSSPPPVAKLPPRKVGLGRIGGPKSKTTRGDDVPRSTSPDEPPKQTATPKKLGVIGKRGADSVLGAGDQSDRGRSREATAPATEAPRESSQERADRKRDELKRELEKKAAAGPAKKKRRF